MLRLVYISVVYIMLCTVHTEAMFRRQDPPKEENTKLCRNCGQHHIVSVDEDFNKLKVDQDVNNHVREILDRLKTFKIPVHPRIRIFYELLKLAMNDHAHRTADSLYVPDKYNVARNTNNQITNSSA